MDKTSMRSILIVDDQPTNLRLATRMLAGTPWRVTIAGSGEEALELTETTTYDVVLLDLSMPVISGIDVAQKLRSKENQTPPYLIACTAYGSYLSESSTTGLFDMTLAKPFLRAALIQTLSEVESILQARK